MNMNYPPKAVPRCRTIPHRVAKKTRLLHELAKQKRLRMARLIRSELISAVERCISLRDE